MRARRQRRFVHASQQSNIMLHRCSSLGVTDTRQHMSQLLERFFTPRSAKAVEGALGAMTKQLAQDEEAQGHALSPGLAALQRGEIISQNVCVTMSSLAVLEIAQPHCYSGFLSLKLTCSCLHFKAVGFSC